MAERTPKQMYLDMARARKLSKFDVLNALYEKLQELDQMEPTEEVLSMYVWSPNVIRRH